MRKNKIKKLLLMIILTAAPLLVSATVEISEVMYDLPSPGSDDNREWVEIQNTGSTDVDISDWKIDDGATSKHGLNIPPANGGQGSMILPPNSFVILADNATTFLSEHSGFSGTVIDTSISLGQQQDKTYTIKLIDTGGIVASSMSYTIALGANGDGNSLQKISGQWKVGTPTPGIANVANSSSGSSSSSGNNPPVGGQSSSTPSQTSSSVNVGLPPEMFVDIVANQTVVVGADALFSGKALDTNGKPLDNVRFFWNFGDGETKEGQNVLHRFRFPSEYIITLDITYGKWSTAGRLTVTAIKSPLTISRVEEGTAGFVEIINQGSAELDLFGWYLKSGNISFLIPKNTIIAGNKKIIFPNEVTKLVTNDVFLLYPNGVVAANYEKTPSPPESDSGKLPVRLGETKPVPTEKPVALPKSDSGSPKSDLGKLDIPTITPSVTAIYEATPESSGLGVWLLALGGLVVVSLGAFVFVKQKPNPTENEASSYKIIE